MKRFIVFPLIIFTLLTNSFAQNREDSLHIAHYDLHLNITDFSTHQIFGHADLQAVAKTGTLNNITLDLQSLLVDSIYVNNFKTTNYVQGGTRINLTLEEPLNQQDTAFLTIYYHGTPATDSYFGGFYFRGQYAYNLGVAFQDTPHNFGRAWYPCLDVFTDKSTYTFHIETEANKKAVCGGLLMDSTMTEDSTIIWTWVLSQPIPTYLASVAVGEYAHYHDTVQGLDRVIPIDIFTYPDNAARVAGTFVNLKDIFHLFEYRFGPYRWDRVGYVEVDFQYGAMEHVCNIAYPSFAITGGTTYESLYAHELSHAWFGNLITCERAEEMWINEGFARYSESLIEEGPYENEPENHSAYVNSVHTLHTNVLTNAHLDDNGYWALNNVPQDVTYGTTSYDKGGLVVHALRQYMGDSLYFDAIKDLLNTHAFQNLNSQQLINHLTNYSGINLQDFYESHINQTGFLHFSIDSINRVSENEYQFYVRQRRSHAQHLGDNNKIDITFFSHEREQVTTEDFTFSGEYATGSVRLPFEPLFAVVDINEKLADATADCDLTITTSSSGSLGSSATVRAILNITAVADTTYVRIENNLAAPDPLKTPNDDIIDMVQTHYWRIETTCDGNIEGKLRLYYKANEELADDYELLHNYTRNDLILLYRRDAADDWRIIGSNISGNISQGCLIADNIISGEYAIGVGNRAAAITNYESQPRINIYPNPAQEYINLDFYNLQKCNSYFVELVDINGKLLQKLEIQNSKEILSIQNLASGIYFVRVFENGKSIDTKKVVKK